MKNVHDTIFMFQPWLSMMTSIRNGSFYVKQIMDGKMGRKEEEKMENKAEYLYLDPGVLFSSDEYFLL